MTPDERGETYHASIVKADLKQGATVDVAYSRLSAYEITEREYYKIQRKARNTYEKEVEKAKEAFHIHKVSTPRKITYVYCGCEKGESK